MAYRVLRCRLVPGQSLFSVRGFHSVLDVGLGGDGEPSVWLIADNDLGRPESMIEILVVGTGEDIPFDLLNHDFLGHFRLDANRFIGHVFMKRIPTVKVLT